MVTMIPSQEQEQVTHIMAMPIIPTTTTTPVSIFLLASHLLKRLFFEHVVLYSPISTLYRIQTHYIPLKKTSNIPISKSKLKQPSSIPVSNSTQRRHSLSTISKPSGVSVSISYYSLSANHDAHSNTNYQIIDILNDAAVLPLNQSLMNPEGHQEPTLTLSEVPVDSYSHLAQTLRNVPKGPLPLDVIGPTIFLPKSL